MMTVSIQRESASTTGVTTRIDKGQSPFCGCLSPMPTFVGKRDRRKQPQAGDFLLLQAERQKAGTRWNIESQKPTQVNISECLTR
jgi:hypothetical protein